MTTSDRVFQAVQIGLSIAPVPGLSAAALVLQEIYAFLKNIALRKSECEALLSYASTVIATIDNHGRNASQSELASAVVAVQKVVSEMQTDMDEWKNYGRAMGYLKNSDILEKIQQHRANLDKALAMVGLAQALEQAEWNKRFSDAQAADHGLIQDIKETTTRVEGVVNDLQHLLLPPTPTSMMNRQAQEQRANAAQQLYRLRSHAPDSGALPSRDMINEVEKSGSRPFHSGPSFDLWKGTWLDQYVVVLKVYREKEPGEGASHEIVVRTNRQTDLWRTLSHPNVLPLYGICHLEAGPNPPVYFVSPWLPNRDAMQYLLNNPAANRLHLIHGVAKGLAYLHSVSILHDALQGSNVLVDQTGNAVLSDFSLSKVMDPDTIMTQTNGPQSSIRWLAPEAQSFRTLTSATDVYSWGMTALEIASGHVPFYKYKTIGQLVVAVTYQQIRPERAHYAEYSPLVRDDQFWNLLQSCWAFDPVQRPSANQVVEQLALMV
ncbi:hypothetical protein FRB94_003863 [Tulasnella sp. JGI-2019a]|nr:hypothetical protein FRB93_013167 [Tulasnella sp. JGI-2019a]KAG9002452.1 hypothetical protein FRB94_003863 [Tulasnella sp. JGI-2019a]KAG9034725.1 hypothetical protein FRB95_012675 [Tulasnella sp. JGI-2019a]